MGADVNDEEVAAWLWRRRRRRPAPTTCSPRPPRLPQLIYDAQLGGADEAALQEAALRQRADRGAAAAGLSAAAAAAQEASLAAKGTASGLVRDVKFLDMDTVFWQIARQHWLQYGAFDDGSIPFLGAGRRVGWMAGKRGCACLANAAGVLKRKRLQQHIYARSSVLTSLLVPPLAAACRAVQGPAGQALAGDCLREQGGCAGRGLTLHVGVLVQARQACACLLPASARVPQPPPRPAWPVCPRFRSRRLLHPTCCLVIG